MVSGEMDVLDRSIAASFSESIVTPPSQSSPLQRSMRSGAFSKGTMWPARPDFGIPAALQWSARLFMIAWSKLLVLLSLLNNTADCHARGLLPQTRLMTVKPRHTLTWRKPSDQNDHDEINKEILQITSEITPGAYMQLVGIVQSIAIGFLLVRYYESIKDDPWSVSGLLASLRFTACFQFFVVAWQVHIQFGTVIKRTFSLRDSYFTFGFLLPEFLVAQYSDGTYVDSYSRYRWLAAFTGLFAFTCLSYKLHFKGRNRRFIVVNRRRLKHVKEYRTVAPDYALIALALCCGTTAFARFYSTEGYDLLVENLAGALVVNGVVFAFTVFHERRFTAKLCHQRRFIPNQGALLDAGLLDEGGCQSCLYRPFRR